MEASGGNTILPYCTQYILVVRSVVGAPQKSYTLYLTEADKMLLNPGKNMSVGASYFFVYLLPNLKKTPTFLLFPFILYTGTDVCF